MSRKSVVVIGGGAAGHQIAYRLQGDADVVLLDPKTYWEVPMAAPRLLVRPESLPARLAYRSFLGQAEHVQGKAVSLGDAAVVARLADGGERTLPFDYAVIASGSTTMDPLIKAQAATEPERSAEIAGMHARLAAARSVVVAGGGPVGVETAAELKETFPALEVTLIHGGHKLLDQAPSRFGSWAHETLAPEGVTVILDDLVTSPAPARQPEDGVVLTQSGRRIAADAVIWAGGVKPASDFVAASWPEAVEPDGRLKVDAYLRLEGHPRLFVAGDLTNLPEARLAMIGGLHVKSIVGNLKALIAAPPGAEPALKPYRPAVPGKGMGKMMVVTLGAADGLTSLPFGQFRASFLARQIKSRDMLVGMARKGVGLPA